MSGIVPLNQGRALSADSWSAYKSACISPEILIIAAIKTTKWPRDKSDLWIQFA